MNYNLYFVGLNYKLFDEILKLLILSARESDYIVENHSCAPENLKSPKRVLLKLNGSLKKEVESILIDFDNLVNNTNIDYKIINKQTFDQLEKLHYWQFIGYLMKIIGDITPAYITGYLIENEMNAESEVFRKNFM